MFSKTIVEVTRFEARRAWSILLPARHRALEWWGRFPRFPRFWRASCGACDEESTPWFMSPVSLQRWADDRGWRLGRSGHDDVCPRCVRENR